jgi:regulator of cell morphogenesis and NO signaling
MLTITNDTTIGNIVADDYRAAAVFQKHGIDFCCGGGQSLASACDAAGVAGAALAGELAKLDQVTDIPVPRFKSWDPGFLTDYIEANHHAYVRGAISTILQHTRKVAQVHGERHPEVIEIARVFEGVAQEMTHHMMKEEHILFPHIRELAAGTRAGRPMPPSPFGSIQNPIRMMEMEHESAGGATARIRQLSGNYTPPDDACATYRVTYQGLQEFERDLHQHVHLENNILFPKAIELERVTGTTD